MRRSQLKNAPPLWLALLGLICGGSAVQAEFVTMSTDSPLAPSGAPTPSLAAHSGVTALAGQVVDDKGAGLLGVRVAEGGQSTVTGADGRFLLMFAMAGKGVLQIDGRAAGAKPADYGFYQVAVEATLGKTTVLPFVNALPLVDHTHEVTIENPTSRDIVLTHPSLPGLEIRIPAGTVIRDADGALVQKIGITPLLKDKWPVPPPQGLDIAASFTVQPGASCLFDAQGGIGVAQVILPNRNNRAPGSRVRLYRYEPDSGGWRGYGGGSVSPDGKTIMPDPSTVLTDFSSAECDPKTKSRPAPPTRIEAWVSESRRQ